MLVIFYSFTSKLKTIFAGDLVHMWIHLDAILIKTCFYDSLGHSERKRLGRLVDVGSRMFFFGN